MKIADSHNHLHFDECKINLDDILNRASCAGVEKILLVGIDPEDSVRARKLSEIHEGFYTTVGIHPQMAREYSKGDVNNLSFRVDKKVVAIGETGFDFFRTPGSFIEQEELFKAHITLSKDHNLPWSYMTGMPMRKQSGFLMKMMGGLMAEYFTVFLAI